MGMTLYRVIGIKRLSKSRYYSLPIGKKLYFTKKDAVDCATDFSDNLIRHNSNLKSVSFVHGNSAAYFDHYVYNIDVTNGTQTECSIYIYPVEITDNNVYRYRGADIVINNAVFEILFSGFLIAQSPAPDMELALTIIDSILYELELQEEDRKVCGD